MPRFQGIPVKKPRFGGVPVVASAELESDTSKEARGIMSEFTQHPSRGAFEQLSVPGKIMQSADDIARLAASGGSFGFADKVAAGGDPERLKAERAMTEGARDRAGWAGTAAELGGSMMTPVGMARQGATLVGKGAMAIPGVQGLLARMGLMGIEGAGYGAANAAGNDQDIGAGAGMGAVAGVGGQALGEGVAGLTAKIGKALTKKPPLPSADDLFEAGDAAYKASEKAGVIIKPEGMQHLHKAAVADLTNDSFDKVLHPRVARALDRIEEDAGNNVTLKGLDTIRKVVSAAYEPMNKENNRLVSKIIGHIDDLIKSNDPAHMAGIDTPQGTAALKEARDYWHRGRKVETVEKMVNDARLNAGATGSGGNVENATRQQVKKILTSEAKGRGFTDAEKELADKAVMGSNTQNALRLAGKLSPQGNGLMMALHLLSTIPSAGMNLPIAGLGIAAKKGAEAMQRNAVGEFIGHVARGGPAPALPEHALERLAKSKQEMLIRALLGGSIATTGGPQ